MNNFIEFLVFLALFLNTYSLKFEHSLKLDNKATLEWLTDEDQRFQIIFKLTITKPSYPCTCGFGFSDNGQLENGDYFIISIKNEKYFTFGDYHTNSEGHIFLDKQSNYNLINTDLNRAKMVVTFSRLLDTCDSEDYLIDSSTTHIIHFVSMQTFKLLNGLKISDISSHLKLTLTQLIRAPHEVPDVTSMDYFDVRNSDTSIPQKDTVYWCKVFKLHPKFTKKHHIVRFEGIIDEKNRDVVHHMELFHCVFDPPLEMTSFSDVCTSETKPLGLRQCRKVVAAWAMGAEPFIYPSHVGGVLGGSNYSLYLVLEIHYDNQKLKQIIDSSGIRIYHTNSDNLREFDAGIMEVGLEYNSKNSIPPNLNAFPLNGYCLSECTKVGLPSSGIIVFASQLHTHLTGRKVITRIKRRDGTEDILNSDYHYESHFQEIRLLKNDINIYPGDTIINTCVYNTMDRNNMTLGGYGIRDEMCVNYIHYYPASKIEICKSSLRDDVLEEFFKRMSQLDLANTSSFKTTNENFNSIRWTPLTSSILKELYDTSYLSFSCNSSDGLSLLRQSSEFKAIKLENDAYLTPNSECL